jgi:hypothetical protein
MKRFIEIIEMLELGHEPNLINVRKRALDAVILEAATVLEEVTSNLFGILIDELKGRLKEITLDMRLSKEIPFLKIFLAHCYFMLRSLPDAIEHARQAADNFRYYGNDYNIALGRWYLGLLYFYDDKPNLCRAELTEAAKLLRKIEKDNAVNGGYLTRDKIRQLLLKINSDIDDAAQAPFVARPEDEVENHDAIRAPASRFDPLPPLVQVVIPIGFENNNTFSPYFSPTTQQFNGVEPRFYHRKGTSSEQPSIITDAPATSIDENEGYLFFWQLPIYQSISGGPRGKEWINPPEIEHTRANSVILDSHKCVIESVSRDNQISIVEQREYGWARVEGNSMNASRIQIKNGDYILFYKSKNANNNDIVIASRPRAESQGTSYMVKRFRGGLLISETTETGTDYDPLPLSEDYQILGVVVAVAKPID